MAEGYISVDVYAELLGNRVFPIARSIRSLRDLEHSAAPDFVHDVLGHLPMLFDPRVGDLMTVWAERVQTSAASVQDRAMSAALSELISARSQSRVDLDHIARLTAALGAAHLAAVRTRSRRFLFETFFTWVFEFGLMKDASGQLSLIGGACLSSPGETARLTGGEVVLRPFQDGAVGHPVDYTVYQDTMFYFTSFDELTHALAAI